MLRIFVCLVCIFFVCGCSVDEALRQNAYLHNRTAEMARSVASSEEVSGELDGLITLSALQSRAFVADYGMPEKPPAATTVDDILADSSFALADTAFEISSDKPDAWDIADGIINAGIGVAGLFGGVWGVRLAAFLRSAKLKSNALREVVLGNEIFRKTHGESDYDFKKAHAQQSTPTRKIVDEIRKS